MAILDDFSGTVIRVAARAASEARLDLGLPQPGEEEEREGENPAAAPPPMPATPEEQAEVARAVIEATDVEEDSIPRLFEVLEALAAENLDAIARVRVFPGGELASGGVLLHEFRAVIEYEPGMKPKRKKKAAEPRTGPRIVRAAVKHALEPETVAAAPVAAVAEQAEAAGAQAPMAEPAPETAAAAPAGEAATAAEEKLPAPPGRVRPKPRGRFTTAGQLHGFKTPAGTPNAPEQKLGQPRLAAPSRPAPSKFAKRPQKGATAPRGERPFRSAKPFGSGGKKPHGGKFGKR